MREIKKEIMRDKMKIKSKFYLSAIILMLSVGFVLVKSADIVAMAGTSDDKGGGVSAQATAGDVSPIQMMPHKNKDELKKKLEKQFKIDGPFGIALHSDNTLKQVGITVKNRSDASKVIKRRALKDYRSDDFYIQESLKFLRKYSKVIGVSNLDKSLKKSLYKGVNKRRGAGGTGVSFNIYISRYLLETSHVSVSFGSDDTIIGARFDIPQITPQLIAAVKNAKTKALSLEEIKKVAGKKFVEMALKEGWTTNASAKVSHVATRYYTPKLVVLDKAPYLVWKLYWYGPMPRSNSSSSFTTMVNVDTVTGEIASYRFIETGGIED